MPLQACDAPAELPTPVSEPASQETRAAVKRCGGRVLAPARILVAEFTPENSGELFMYVNDALLLWRLNADFYYRNNSGTAKVVISPVLATQVISR